MTDGVLDSLPYFKSQLYKLLVQKNGKVDMSNMISRYNLFWVGLFCRITHSDVVLSSTWKFGWNEDGTVNMDHKGHCMIETDKLLRKYGVNLVSITRKGKLQLNKNHDLDENALKAWCSRQSIPSITDPDEREQALTYGRGTQIYDWLERNKFTGKFLILDDDIDDIIIYKDLAKRLVHTSYYKGIGGFGFRHFVKAILLFLKQEKFSA